METFILFLANLKGISEFLELMLLTRFKFKYERSSSFLAKSFLAKILFCFDFGIWLPQCFGYETEEKEKEKEESEGERKWMALFRGVIF